MYVPKVSHNTFDISGYDIYYSTTPNFLHPIPHKYQLYLLISWPLVSADSATISITNTKNGTKGAFVHHDAFGGDICPVAALACRIANLRGMRASTPLSTLCHPPTRTTEISNRDVTIAVRWGATYNGPRFGWFTEASG